MTTEQLLILAGVIAATVAIAALLIFVFVRKNSERQRKLISDELAQARRETAEALAQARRETAEAVNGAMASFSAVIAAGQTAASSSQDKRLAELAQSLRSSQAVLQRSVNDMLQQIDGKMKTLSENNDRKLEQMRQTVDEKLQKTLEERLGQSFKLVSERLDLVSKGLGEMQVLATGVGDLKKVLSNVKTRGVLGEVQLESIISEFLNSSQYDKNVATVPNSGARVEFAVKMPTEDGGFMYMPVDSKFPGDTYAALRDAYDSADPVRIEAAAKVLVATVRGEAKDIRDKYISPPDTTDFGIMFLPFEGLYAEVVNRGVLEMLQHEFRVIIAGPSTMAALLNSLQMSFRSFAIQKRSGDVWKVLGAIKKEFENFAGALDATRKKLRQADDELDKLVGTRTNVMRRALREVEALDDASAAQVLKIQDGAVIAEDFDGNDDGIVDDDE